MYPQGELRDMGLRRITFLVHKRKALPKYFTYRARDDVSMIEAKFVGKHAGINLCMKKQYPDI